MILETIKISVEYVRVSKLGVPHNYMRHKTVVVIKCDNCGNTFQRDLSKMDHRRLNNNYFHVCSNCNPKRFAQRKGVERRGLWNTSVDKDIDIGRF
jgi:predicted RNA-binding Zn-ribbon protein involved in translation (DUF1610 family)